MTEIRKLRVVIVDDYEMTRTLLKIILRGEQFDLVGEAADGQAGMELCERLKPDLVFLDVMMPVMNGLQALEQIHAMLPQAMILMVTGHDEQAIVDQAIQKGACGFIVKPFNTASVIQTLDEVCETFVIREAARVKN